MHFAEDPATAHFVIHSYSASSVIVNDQQLNESFMLLVGQPIQPWKVTANERLRPDHFAAVIESGPELVILGTGSHIRLPDPDVYGALLSRKIGLETMATAAACRTYNLLAQDGRNVAACLILPA